MENLRQINLFLVLHYVEPWFTATIPAAAPRTDLKLLQNIISYSTICTKVASIAQKAFQNHLWYLSPVNVALAFFDDMVSDSTKVKMVENLVKSSKVKVPPKRVKLSAEDMRGLPNVDLDYFVNCHTMKFFSTLELDTTFLSAHPSTWKGNQSYMAALETVQSLQVVNDVCERAVKLTTDYNCQLTKSEESFQDLLLVRSYI